MRYLEELNSPLVGENGQGVTAGVLVATNASQPPATFTARYLGANAIISEENENDLSPLSPPPLAPMPVVLPLPPPFQPTSVPVLLTVPVVVASSSSSSSSPSLSSLLPVASSSDLVSSPATTHARGPVVTVVP